MRRKDERRKQAFRSRCPGMQVLRAFRTALGLAFPGVVESRCQLFDCDLYQ